MIDLLVVACVTSMLNRTVHLPLFSRLLHPLVCSLPLILLRLHSSTCTHILQLLPSITRPHHHRDGHRQRRKRLVCTGSPHQRSPPHCLPGGGARITTVLEKDSDTREIGSLAVWSVSSAKPGNGVELLRDSNTDTYWQSDGMQPHMVSIQFQRKVPVIATEFIHQWWVHTQVNLVRLAIYLDYKHDESYTPNRISVRAGTCFHDLKEIKALELEEPSGWVIVPLCPEPGYVQNGCLPALWQTTSVQGPAQGARHSAGHHRQPPKRTRHTCPPSVIVWHT